VELDFVKKRSPKLESDHEGIARGLSFLKNLTTLKVSGAVQTPTIEAINKLCIDNFKTVKTLIIDFESIKKEATEGFIGLFSKDHLEKIVLTKINMNIYPYLKNNEIKLKSYKVHMPQKMTPHLFSYLTEIGDTIQELEIYQD
jgi:DNA topoisomerase IA